MFCSKCGKELGEGEKFCPNCGAKTDKGESDAGDILRSVSSKAREGASYAAEQVKQIDVNDMKGIFTNVTKQDSIVYLIAGGLLLLSNAVLFLRCVLYGWHIRRDSGEFYIYLLSLILLIVLSIYFSKVEKVKKGILSSSQVILGITTILSLLAVLHWLPAFLNVLRLLICIVIGVALAAVGAIKLCKDMEQNKPVEVSNPAGANNFNMNGVPIANYDARFDYTPIGMWGYFLYNILFNIPLIGWICWIIFAVGGTRNINLRNFARSYICLYIVTFVMFLLIGLFVAALF